MRGKSRRRGLHRRCRHLRLDLDTRDRVQPAHHPTADGRRAVFCDESAGRFGFVFFICPVCFSFTGILRKESLSGRGVYRGGCCTFSCRIWCGPSFTGFTGSWPILKPVRVRRARPFWPVYGRSVLPPLFIVVMVQSYLLLPLLIRPFRRFGGLTVVSFSFLISLAAVSTTWWEMRPNCRGCCPTGGHDPVLSVWFFYFCLGGWMGLHIGALRNGFKGFPWRLS